MEALPSLLAPSSLLRRAGVARRENSAGGTSARIGRLRRRRAASSRTLRGVARVVVEVMLKPEIHDPQGEAIAAACQRLGFGQVLGVRQGKRFEVEISGPAGADEVGQIRALAAELLANPVIEEFSVHAPEPSES
jgi:phosphoribosylformylglycinamidine synthase